MNLAQRLIKAKVVTPEELAPAIYRQKQHRGFLGDHLLELELVDPGVLARFVHPYPRLPESFEELGIPRNFIAQLVLKHAFFHESVSLRELARDLKMSKPLVEEVVDQLRAQKYFYVKPRDFNGNRNTLAMEMYYGLSETGKLYAEQCLEANRYVGPAPVPLEDYWDWVERQSIHQVQVNQARLEEVFSAYVVPPYLVHKVGPAINSGRAIFLFGPSGNGKTAMANCIGHAFEDTVYIPYSLYIYGQIIRLYDEVNHQAVPANDDFTAHDPRWVLCRRPVVIAGGEMTEDAIDLKFNPVHKFYEAPHQLRANNGVFVIDDFGRQRLTPRELLNRWMYPLENRQDFLCLHTGQQFSVPFDQLIIFSTNLNPFSLADEAFLRRIRHKIYIGYVSPEQYLEIFRRVCDQHDIHFDPEVVRDAIGKYYLALNRPLCACHPLDLIQNLLDRCRFLGVRPVLTHQELDWACQSYFVKPLGIDDYDAISEDPPTLV